MNSYDPNTSADKEAMLECIGAKSVCELFSDIPEEVILRSAPDIGGAMSESQVIAYMKKLASDNRVYSSDRILRGAGSYSHFIPAVVDRIASKEEFVTAYTPYQPEISQGILQSIFEYQTMICTLTDMDVSNASVYDGACACAEAVSMCRVTKDNTVVLSQALNPEVIKVVETYGFGAGDSYLYLPVDSESGKTNISSLDKGSCVVIAQPNYYGVIEDISELCRIAHDKGIKVIVYCNSIALALLKTPGECGADIAVGDGQPLGIPLSYGGPYIGFIACKAAFMRKIPGRVVGQTVDSRGNTAYVLTLQAREQHIRREKASSNICSNQALCALRCCVYLSCMGAEGLKNIAQTCAGGAQYLQKKLCSEKGIRLKYTGDFFHEFLTEFESEMIVFKIIDELDKLDILGGLPIGRNILWCVTENTDSSVLDETYECVRRCLNEADI